MENNIKEKPSYYTLTPATVRYDDRLSLGAIILYGEITCLTHAYGFCTANNRYFADLYKKDRSTIIRWMQMLSHYEYIKIVSESFGDNRKIYITDSVVKMQQGIAKIQEGYCDNATHNNKYNKEYIYIYKEGILEKEKKGKGKIFGKKKLILLYEKKYLLLVAKYTQEVLDIAIQNLEDWKIHLASKGDQVSIDKLNGDDYYYLDAMFCGKIKKEKEWCKKKDTDKRVNVCNREDDRRILEQRKKQQRIDDEIISDRKSSDRTLEFFYNLSDNEQSKIRKEAIRHIENTNDLKINEDKPQLCFFPRAVEAIIETLLPIYYTENEIIGEFINE